MKNTRRKDKRGTQGFTDEQEQPPKRANMVAAEEVVNNKEPADELSLIEIKELMLVDIEITVSNILHENTKISNELVELRNTVKRQQPENDALKVVLDKIKKQQDDTETGYSFVSQPTLSNAGGVGFYIKNDSSLHDNVKPYKRDYSKFNPQDMISEFQSINWQTVISIQQDSSSIFSSYYNVMSTIIDKHIPVKQLSKRERKFLSKPWITFALRKSIYVKNNLYKQFIKTRSTYIHTKFKLYRNKLNHLLKISKKEYSRLQQLFL